jgi:hypothetical protein
MLHVCRLGRAIALDKLIQEAALMALQALNLKRLQETPKTQINKQQQTARNRKKQQQTPANRNEQLLKRQNSRKDSSRSIAKEQSQIVPNNLNSSNTKHKSAI